MDQADELHGRLVNLKFRIFGQPSEDPHPPSSLTPSEMSLDGAIQAAHYRFNECLKLLNEIQTQL